MTYRKLRLTKVEVKFQRHGRARHQQARRRAAALRQLPGAVARGTGLRPGAHGDPVRQLATLSELHAGGDLTDAQFEAMKATIINQAGQ
jgi:Short C-terminal domain